MLLSIFLLSICAQNTQQNVSHFNDIDIICFAYCLCS